ncbi:MAG: DnaJ domain-containing protein, partial [Myxococcota bacterium]
MRDPYQVLGVDRKADADTIRKAYRKLAREWHPDVNHAPGAAERFKEINAANDVLSDPERRRLFDQFGEASTRPGFDAQRARQWSRGRRGGADGSPIDLDDLLGSIFGVDDDDYDGDDDDYGAAAGGDDGEVAWGTMQMLMARAGAEPPRPPAIDQINE